MEGDSVTLNTDFTQIQGFILIQWRFGDTVIALTNDDKTTYPSHTEIFRDRVQLDNQTGSLTIENMRTKHSGLYKLQIDHNTGTTHRKFTVTVYGELYLSLNPANITCNVFSTEIKLMSLKEGDPVILQTDVPQLQGDELIVWRFGDEGKLIAKADIEAKSSPLYDETDERFRDRLKLNDQTGSLIITNTRTTDSGLYTAKISNKTVSVMEGDSVTLNTNLTEILNDDTLLWLFGPKEFVISQITRKSVLTSFLVTDDVRFRGRLQVDQITGSLTIRNTRKRHSGQYKLTISREKITSRIFSVDVFGKYLKSISFIECYNDLVSGFMISCCKETNDTECDVADGIFRNKLVLNVKTGDLIINNIRTIHSGLYKLQISRKNGKTEYMIFIVTVTGELINNHALCEQLRSSELSPNSQSTT
uniref:Ig-like domain-containing protein n=1 Tax=Sinocyclocheilus anshuiensis TaxID=1608454 RepID=A0A671PGU2_9TELE